ncbi:MAG: FimD/PapC C-terminal domain-containing protein, partial [Hydrogenophilaceae bacterium]
ESGRALPPGALVRLAGDAREFQVGYDGLVFISGLAANNRLQAEWDDQRCRTVLVLDEAAEPLPDLGTLVCAAERANALRLALIPRLSAYQENPGVTGLVDVTIDAEVATLQLKLSPALTWREYADALRLILITQLQAHQDNLAGTETADLPTVIEVGTLQLKLIPALNWPLRLRPEDRR